MVGSLNYDSIIADYICFAKRLRAKNFAERLRAPTCAIKEKLLLIKVTLWEFWCFHLWIKGGILGEGNQIEEGLGKGVRGGWPLKSETHAYSGRGDIVVGRVSAASTTARWSSGVGSTEHPEFIGCHPR